MSATTVGVFGKLPAERDFVRIDAGTFCTLGGDEWLQEGVEGLKRDKTTLPEDPVGFVLTLPDGGTSFVGAFVPGEDAVGRQFPLAVFFAVEDAAIARAFSVVPVVAQDFLGAAVALLSNARALSAEELGARAQAIAPPRDFAAAASVAEPLLTAASGADLIAALGPSSDAGAYAFRTLVGACEQGGKTLLPSRAAGVTVDAPVPSDASLVMWLEIVRQRFVEPAPTRAVPSYFWTASGGGRLLIAMGAAPSSVLPYLGNARHPSSRLWPLRTESAAALEAARAHLSARQQQTLDARGPSLLDLARAFATEGA